MSGFSSTVIIVTVGSILGGRGIWIWYLLRSTPTRMPSSTSAGATRSPSPTTNFAICFTLMTYFVSSVFAPMILVQRATCGRAVARVRGGAAAGSGDRGERARLQRLLLLHHLLVRHEVPLRRRCKAGVRLLDAHQVVDLAVEALQVLLGLENRLVVRPLTLWQAWQRWIARSGRAQGRGMRT